MLDVIARWVAPEEQAGGAVYRYLIGGEAFDWLRLAERLIGAAGKAIPAAEAERLLFDGKPPPGHDDSEEAFARAIGHEKHRAHLNFQYGVTVEEVLLLQAELDLVKARNLDGPRGTPPDVAAYERVYGRSLKELIVEYRAETGQALPERALQSQLRAFTYWCSKFRFRLAEPARVASDTRKALALLSRMETERVPRERRLPGVDRKVIEAAARAPRRRSPREGALASRASATTPHTAATPGREPRGRRLCAARGREEAARRTSWSGSRSASAAAARAAGASA